MNDNFSHRLNSLSPSALSLYHRLKGSYGLKIDTLSANVPGSEIEELKNADLLYVFSRGGVIVFTSEHDIENKHPRYVEERKAKEIERFTRNKEIQAMLYDVVEVVGLEALKHKLLTLCGANDSHKHLEGATA